MKKTLLTLIALAATLVAQAGPITGSLAIDFRTPAWNASNGQHSFATGNVGAAAYALNIFGDQVNAKLRQNGTDGLGVDSSVLGEDPGEVGPREILNINFTTSSGSGLTGVWLTQLFNEIIGDYGFVQLFDANGLLSTISFSGNASDGNRYVDFNGPLNLLQAKFYSDLSLVSVPFNSDYSVAGFTKQAAGVPDGGTTSLMLGLALLALGFARRANR